MIYSLSPSALGFKHWPRDTPLHGLVSSRHGLASTSTAIVGIDIGREGLYRRNLRGGGGYIYCIRFDAWREPSHIGTILAIHLSSDGVVGRGRGGVSRWPWVRSIESMESVELVESVGSVGLVGLVRRDDRMAAIGASLSYYPCRAVAPHAEPLRSVPHSRALQVYSGSPRATLSRQ